MPCQIDFFLCYTFSVAKYNRATKQKFSLDKKSYYYWTLGDLQNSPLLIFPGFTGEHDDQLKFAHNLKEKYFVIIPDLPGWGQSARLSGELTIENYVKFYRLLMETLGIREPSLLGHCMGTSIAILYALSFPGQVGKIFLVSTPYTEHTLSKKLFLHLAEMGERSPKAIRPIFYFWRGRLITAPLTFVVVKFKTWRKRFGRSLREIWVRKKQDEKAVEENWDSFIRFNFERAKGIKKPVHIIHGAKDLLIGVDLVERFYSLLPNATLDILPQAGHLPPLETPESLARLILKY